VVFLELEVASREELTPLWKSSTNPSALTRGTFASLVLLAVLVLTGSQVMLCYVMPCYEAQGAKNERFFVCYCSA
jgi:hypothetical protein